MSRQRRMHCICVIRERAYKKLRRYGDGYRYKHHQRWRQSHGIAYRSFRQNQYWLFGPTSFEAEQRWK